MPTNGDYKFYGLKWTYYFLALFTIVGTVRSFLHIFLEDGGTESIAAMNINVEGGSNLVAMFAQWGQTQLILAYFYWIALIWQKHLVPACLSCFFFEQFTRLLIGFWKPIENEHAAPGGVAAYGLAPLALIAFICSLIEK